MFDVKVYKYLKKFEFYLFLIWVIVKIVERELCSNFNLNNNCLFFIINI